MSKPRIAVLLSRQDIDALISVIGVRLEFGDSLAPMKPERQERLENLSRVLACHKDDLKIQTRGY